MTKYINVTFSYYRNPSRSASWAIKALTSICLLASGLWLVNKGALAPFASNYSGALRSTSFQSDLGLSQSAGYERVDYKWEKASSKKYGRLQSLSYSLGDRNYSGQLVLSCDSQSKRLYATIEIPGWRSNTPGTTTRFLVKFDDKIARYREFSPTFAADAFGAGTSSGKDARGFIEEVASSRELDVRLDGMTDLSGDALALTFDLQGAQAVYFDLIDYCRIGL